MEATKRKQNYLGDNAHNQLLLLTDQRHPRLRIHFGGNDADRAPMEVDAVEFVGIKSFKAKGKRLTTLKIDEVELLPPLPEDEQEEEVIDEEPVDDNSIENLDPDAGKSQQQVIDELTGQLNLFDQETENN